MKLFYNFSKSIIMYVCVFLLIVGIVFLPRDLSVGPSHQRYVMAIQYHMDWSTYVRHIIHYLKALILHGNLGKTNHGLPVSQAISEFMPRSMLIILLAFLITFPLGILKGIYDFRRSKKRFSLLGHGSTFLMLALPDFFIIILFQWMLINLFPFIRGMAFGYEHWYSFVFPTLLVSIYPIFYYARMTAAALGSQEGRPYIQVAKSKGFNDRFVLYKHMLANCWSTLISHLPTGMIYILSNLLIVEYLMDYKGGAYRLFRAFDYSSSFHPGQIQNFEAEVIVGFSILFMLIMLGVHLLCQLISYLIEPKI